MSPAQQLLQRYRSHLELRWPPHLSATERVWIAVYDPEEERRMRAALPEFALVTEAAGVQWAHVDLTDAFAQWMNAHPYRDDYFREPELLSSTLPEFEEQLLEQLRTTLTALPPRSVVGVTGAGALFGLTRISKVIERAAPALQGRMLLFFPGSLDGHNYRLFNARDGWNYHSVALVP
ncbi:BREX protein BrxB domain-containing protein [Deinococcus sp. QL22]|uniref:BREX protein BrxB domain-containing protein n=1 Tax=Deinococcus sp. QL22 TaxID=2939437 RepID=UPI00201803C9|nr:BREX protein BrxB domain-containing protein [Deinococcus sp. QL22]UQN08794.1 DUF1788 domain-containing protein [Deinococcus sp. QL22]